MRRLFGKLRVAFPPARLRVRLDGGFATPAAFTFLEAEGVESLVAMASNARLAKRIRRLLGRARVQSTATGQSAQVCGETRNATKSWGRKRRVYEIYRERGDVENRLKELHDGLGFDRTSCTAFWANAFRVLLTAAAYVLLQALRERRFKLGARVQVSARRIVLHLPSAFPCLTL